jgi:sugar phosphate isomerase/epimerase
MLAFSTCWNNSRHTEGEPMIDEILALGFRHVELSHGMTVTKLPGLRKAFQDGRFTCVGIHNFFPSPVEVLIDAPDAFQFTSHRPSERRRALEMSKRTLELAIEFRARYLVLHMGSVPMAPAKWTRRLTALLRDGRQLDPAYAKHKVAFVRKREKIAPLYFERARATLEELAPLAAAAGIILAVESRSRYEDMPSEREMLRLMEHFKDQPAVRYWHDFGHVQLKHNLGLVDHAQWLDRVAPYWFGGHLHDVQWPDRDHRTPFTGSLDYDSLLRHVPPGTPLTWELSPSRKADEVRDALHLWRAKFPDHA